MVWECPLSHPVPVLALVSSRCCGVLLAHCITAGYRPPADTLGSAPASPPRLVDSCLVVLASSSSLHSPSPHAAVCPSHIVSQLCPAPCINVEDRLRAGCFLLGTWPLRGPACSSCPLGHCLDGNASGTGSSQGELLHRTVSFAALANPPQSLHRTRGELAACARTTCYGAPTAGRRHLSGGLIAVSVGARRSQHRRIQGSMPPAARPAAA